MLLFSDKSRKVKSVTGTTRYGWLVSEANKTSWKEELLRALKLQKEGQHSSPLIFSQFSSDNAKSQRVLPLKRDHGAEDPQLPQRDAENCKSKWKWELDMTARAIRALKSPKQYCISLTLHRDITGMTTCQHEHHLKTPPREKTGESKGKVLSWEGLSYFSPGSSHNTGQPQAHSPVQSRVH